MENIRSKLQEAIVSNIPWEDVYTTNTINAIAENITNEVLKIVGICGECGQRVIK